MAKPVAFLELISCLFILLQGIHSVNFTVNVSNTSETARFNRDIGVNYSSTMLNSSTNLIWSIFHQNTFQPYMAERKSLEKVSLFVDGTAGSVVAYTVNDQIHVSAEYIQNYSGHVRREFTGILHQEMTRIWQNNCNGQAPQWLVDGIADFVRLRAGLAPSHWVKGGQGERWDQVGQGVTARFLDFCHSWKDCIVAELNRNMKMGYSENFFFDVFGMPVDKLWVAYKANFSTNG